MIVDSGGRYVLAFSGVELARYDMRWHKTSRSMPSFSAQSLLAGVGAGLLVSEGDGTLEAAVCRVDKPVTLLAKAHFNGEGWSFSGDNQAWANVPEYILTSAGGLIRIADGASLDPLDEMDHPLTVVAIPNSRLVVISAKSGLYVYDATASRVVANLSLNNDAKPTQLAIGAEGEELWLNNGQTLMKVGTRSFEPLDAAGLEEGSIKFWQLDNSDGCCAVLQDDNRSALLIDSKQMLPIAMGEFSIDVDEVVVLPGQKILGFSRENASFARPKSWLEVPAS